MSGIYSDSDSDSDCELLEDVERSQLLVYPMLFGIIKAGKIPVEFHSAH